MNTDAINNLVEEADALDPNSRLLRMFEIEPLIAAAADSPEKHRAFARVYAALGRYQTALTHFQTTSNRKDSQDRADFAYLKNLAEHYGDDKQPTERPLPVTAELKAALPQFKYCPDPLASGISARRKKPSPATAAAATPKFSIPIPFTAAATSTPFAPSASPADAPPKHLRARLLSATTFRRQSAKRSKTNSACAPRLIQAGRKRNGQTTAATTAPLSAMPTGKTWSGKASPRA